MSAVDHLLGLVVQRSPVGVASRVARTGAPAGGASGGAVVTARGELKQYINIVEQVGHFRTRNIHENTVFLLQLVY